MIFDEGREKLFELEKNGSVLFHGSGDIIENFEPRQAFDYVDGKQIPDGPPAVFATPFLDCAIFKALISKKNFPKGSYSAWSAKPEGGFIFKASKETIKGLRNEMIAYVYIFSKNEFQKKSGIDWVSYDIVRPIRAFIVRRSDFILPIEEIKE